MQGEVVWSAWDGRMLEHLRLTTDGDGVVADGLLVGVREDATLRLRYGVRCDAGWGVRAVRVGVPDSEAPGVDLLADGEGNWTTPDGETLPGLDGCVDVDISATPFTNTLPIRRLALAPERSVEIDVAYVDVDEMRAWKEPQRYTCLERRADSGTYRFEALDGGFTADLATDDEGLILDYPGLFRRVFSG